MAVNLEYGDIELIKDNKTGKYQGGHENIIRFLGSHFS